jgi:hypothetical protein
MPVSTSRHFILGVSRNVTSVLTGQQCKHVHKTQENCTGLGEIVHVYIYIYIYIYICIF